MASLKTEAVAATPEEISPHLEALLRDVADVLSDEELTSVVATIKNTFKGNFQARQDQDLYSCLQLFTNQGLLSDENLTVLDRFVACKSSKKEGIKQRIETFKLRRQQEVKPRQILKGRDTDSNAIMSKLAGKQPIVNLYGSGGVGKTTLGKDVCLKWPGKSIPVDLREVTEMKDVYFHIMLALDPKGTIIKYEENPVIEQLRKLLKESQDDVLLLLDNVDQFSGGDDDPVKGLPNTKLVGFLRRLNKDLNMDMKGNEEKARLKVLLISRTRFEFHARGLDESDYYELKALERGISKEIFQVTGGLANMESNQIEKLVKLCKGKPLLLNGLAAILRQKIATAGNLLKTIEQELEKKPQDKTNRTAKQDKQDRETWDCLSEGIDDEQLSCLRKMFFLLPSDTLKHSALAVSLFCRPFSEEAAAFVLNVESSEAVILLEGLRSSKVLSVDPEAKELLYDIHPLMRSFLRSVGTRPVFNQVYTKAKDRFNNLYMTKMKDIAAMLDKDYVSAFELFDHDKPNFELALDISLTSDYLHVPREFHEAIMVCYLFEAMLDENQRRKSFKSWAEKTEEDGKEGSLLFRVEMRCFEALQVLRLQGWKNATDVLNLAEDSLKIVHKELKHSDPYRLAQSIFLYVEGEIYYRKGSLQRALKSLFLSLEIMEDLLENHTSTTRCLNAIGNCYNELGNPGEALKFYTRAYEMRKELSGSKNHIDLPFYKGQLGTVYEGQKQYDKAIQCYQEALELSKELKRSGIFRLALFHRNIANAYAWKREFEEAYKPAMDAYEIRKDILGDHPDTARSAFQVGEICKSLEEFDEAEEFLAEAWRIEQSLGHGNHSAVRDRIVHSYESILRRDRKKEFQKEALEFYQRLWMEEKEFSFANKSIIDEINTRLNESGDRKMMKKYEKEALWFYEMAWNSPDLQQLPYLKREDILQNVLHLCKELREKELLKKYQGEKLQFCEQLWEEQTSMTTQDKIDILCSLQDLAAKQGDGRKREKYKTLYEETKRGAPSQQSIQVERLTGVGEVTCGGGSVKIGHKPESIEQLQVQEETKTGTSEKTSTNKCGIREEGSLSDQQEPALDIQFSPKQGGPEKTEFIFQTGTLKDEGVLPEKVKESQLCTTTNSASGIITSQGGMVKAEGVQLVCPPGAVDNPVSIKITLEDPVKYYGLIVQRGLENDVMFGGPIINLQPNGHLFKKPVTLTTKIKIEEGNLKSEDVLVLHGTEAGDGKIAWQDITQNAILNVAKKEVSIEVQRFSLIFIFKFLTVARIRTKAVVSRLNVLPFNYTMSVLFKEDSFELALVFMSQDIFHEPYYVNASALVQLVKNDGFRLVRSIDGPTDKRIYNNEKLNVSVRLGEDYELSDSQQSSLVVIVESHVWWNTGHVIMLPLKEINDVRILCGKICVQGEYGHNNDSHFCERDLRGFVRCLLGVKGAIFNVIPIAQKLGTPEGLMTQIKNSWKDENEQLEIPLQPWLKENGEKEDPANLRKGLEELKEEDYKVTQRGQMHISHLRELAVKISKLKIKNAELMTYFSGKIQDLCKKVLRDCCIELESSVEDVERVASYESYVNYLENYPQISQSTASKYEQMCSSSEESMAKHFLSIVPHLIQDVKAICRDEMIPDVQNGLRGLQEEILNKHAFDVREAKRNNNIRKLVCQVCKILENLCVNNRDSGSQHSTELIRKWGSSLGIYPILELLKPFFQKCPHDVRLYKRLELFSCHITDIVSDELDVDEVFVRDCFDVSSTLIHFAKSDPSKLVRFELTDSTNHPVTCKRESVVHDTDSDTYSQVFFPRKESEDELLLHAAARVHGKGQVHKVGAFQSVIILPASAEEAFDKCMTRHSTDVAVIKPTVSDSQDIRVVLCSTQKEKLSLLVDDVLK